MIQPTLNFEHSRPTQAGKILQWLQDGNRITGLQALNMFGCMRLASRVAELRKAGHPIIPQMVEKNGKRYAEYRLEK